MGDQNLVIERRPPPGGHGAVLVYLDDEYKGSTLFLLKRRDDYAEQCLKFGEWAIGCEAVGAANPIWRTVNGERGKSAWFPRVEPGEYRVSIFQHGDQKSLCRKATRGVKIARQVRCGFIRVR